MKKLAILLMLVGCSGPHYCAEHLHEPSRVHGIAFASCFYTTAIKQLEKEKQKITSKTVGNRVEKLTQSSKISNACHTFASGYPQQKESK